MATPLVQAALDLVIRGYAAHWLYPHSKKPIGEGWSTRAVMTADELRAAYQSRYNLGVRCGAWSRPREGYGFVAIDIDIKHPDVHPEPFEVLARFYDGPVVDVLSGSGLGRHWWFCCPLDRLPPKANTTLAQSEDTILQNDKPIPIWKIEILSTGKQIVVPPSIHPSGKPYRWLTDYDALPELPESILDAIREAATPQAPRTASLPSVPSIPGSSIAAAFNARVSWADILEPHGWQFVREQGERLQWCRPGKNPRDGISATTTGDVFYCFSSSTEFESERGYSKFAVYAVLEHAGDMSQAGRALHLASQGRAA